MEILNLIGEFYTFKRRGMNVGPVSSPPEEKEEKAPPPVPPPLRLPTPNPLFPGLARLVLRKL